MVLSTSQKEAPRSLALGRGRGEWGCSNKQERPSACWTSRKKTSRQSPSQRSGRLMGGLRGPAGGGIFTPQAWRPSADVTQRSGKPKATGAADAATPDHGAGRPRAGLFATGIVSRLWRVKPVGVQPKARARSGKAGVAAALGVGRKVLESRTYQRASKLPADSNKWGRA